MLWIRRQLKALWRLSESYGPAGHTFVILALSTFIYGIANIFVFFHPAALASQIIGTLTIAFAQYYQEVSKRNTSVLVELTVSYIVDGSSPLLDRLLGKLISGTWRRDELKPGNALFRVLNDQIKSGDFWKRRRIAEALPMLGIIDLGQTQKMIKTLRNDWSEKWKSDLRRRTIEALYFRISPDSEYLINELRPNYVKEILAIREGDEIYTAMAIIEAIEHWTKPKEEVRNESLEENMTFVRGNFSIEEQAAIEWLKDQLLDDAKARSADDQLAVIKNGLKSENLFVQIAASRNILAASARKPIETLRLIKTVADDKRNDMRNVRRPLAKERTVRFVMDHAASGSHSNLAKDILQSLLIKDDDKIIRVTLFDEIDYMIEKNKELARDLCAKVVKSEQTDELKDRATRVLNGIDSGEGLL